MQDLQKEIIHNQILLMLILEKLGLSKEEVMKLNIEVAEKIEKEYERKIKEMRESERNKV